MRRMTLLIRKEMETGMSRGEGRRWRRDEEEGDTADKEGEETGMRRGEGRRWRQDVEEDDTAEKEEDGMGDEEGRRKEMETD